MKKVLVALVAIGAVYAAWRAYAEDHDERDLWAAVTDSVD
ncbi:MAG TPA: DLW-39 family protein [Actinotalea sp.]|nr:DLW-39 family protein [Actinotalea sp.]